MITNVQKSHKVHIHLQIQNNNEVIIASKDIIDFEFQDLSYAIRCIFFVH